jgi:ankyrin repeat protein
MGIQQDFIQACKTGDIDAVNALIQHYYHPQKWFRGMRQFSGYEIDLHSIYQGGTPLMLAALYGQAAVVEALIPHLDLDALHASDSQGYTTLTLAAARGHLNVVRALLAVPNILVNQTTNQTNSALIWATKNRHIEIVRALLAAPGINVNHANRMGETALYWAAENGNNAALLALLAVPGIDVNKRGGQMGDTALMLAAQNGNTEAVTALLAAPGMNINTTTYGGETAIVVAFENAQMHIVTLLQAHGAVLPAHLVQAGVNVNRAQSVHEISVHLSVSKSAENLQAYFNFPPAQIIEQTRELFTWLSADFSEDTELPAEYKPEWLPPARNSVCRLNMLDFTDLRSGVSMQDALALVWAGINNTQAKGADKPLLSQTEITSRRVNFLKNLYEIQREYNLADGAAPNDNGGADHATCVSGSFNKLIAALNEVGHAGVQVIFVTPTVITLQVPFLTKQAFCTLSDENKKRFVHGWNSENSESLQAECFGLLQTLVNNKLHELYDEFNEEVPNLNLVITNAAANVEHTDLDAIIEQEREAIQKQEQAELAELAEREQEAAMLSAALPTPALQPEPVIFAPNAPANNIRGVKRTRKEVANPSSATPEAPISESRYPKRVRSFTGSYKV